MEIDVTKIIKTIGEPLEIEVYEPLLGYSLDFEGIRIDQTIRVSAQLTNKGEGRLRLTGRAKVTCRGECARCNEPVRQDLEVDLDEEVLLEPPTYRSEPRLISDLAETEYCCEGTKLSLNTMIWENLLPELPLRVLCHEDCQGLCLQCGANLNLQQCTCQSEVVTLSNQSPFGALSKLIEK